LTVPIIEPIENPQFEMFQVTEAEEIEAGELEGIRVLLVDDSVDNEMLVRAYLKDTGVRLEVAHNGAEALIRARDQIFDMVLMDIQMPVMDGLEATRHLRDRNYDRPIVALSAHARPEEIERSIAAGCHSHLSKPILRNTLIAQIKSLAFAESPQ
jgi:CheY-like chemotaxis protein